VLPNAGCPGISSATVAWKSLQCSTGNFIPSISFCTGMFYMDSYSFNNVLMLSKLLKCICFFRLTLSLEPYCIPLQQFWDRIKDQTTANLHWEFEEHNMTIHHCEDWQNDHFCGWGPDVLWTRYSRCETSVHHRLVLSSLSKTGTLILKHHILFLLKLTFLLTVLPLLWPKCILHQIQL
jgi:hypothetical protein